MGYLKFALAAAYAAGLLMYPETALTAAREAMEMWYRSVAPALFPFAVMMPYLTSEQARYIYDKLMGKLMCLFALPGRCAPALVTGLISGSPGGAMAAAHVASAEGLSAGQASRLAAVCCCMSPVYLVSGLGNAIMGSTGMGWRLTISQWTAAFAVGIIFRGCWRDDPGKKISVGKREEQGIMTAIAAVMRACGYMVLFSVGIALTERESDVQMGMTAIVLDIPGSAKRVLGTDVPGFAVAGAAGFGGLSIAFQNMAVLKNVGVSWFRYIIHKIAAGMLSAGMYIVLDKLPAFTSFPKDNVVFEWVVIVILLVSIPVTAAFFLRERRESTYS